MRTYTIFILSICFIVLNIQGQEKIEFNRSKINDKVLKGFPAITKKGIS